MPFYRDPDTLGTKLGPKLAKLFTEAHVAARRTLAPLDRHIRRAATQDVIDQAGREVAEHFGPLIDKILDADDGTMDSDVRKFLADARSGEHQLKALGGIATGAIQGVIGEFLSNELAPFVYRVVHTNPHLLLDPASHATAVAARWIPHIDGENAAGNLGYDGNEFAMLVHLAEAYPGMGDALDMYRRRLIDSGEFFTIAKRNAVPDNLLQAWLALRDVPLPPDLAALAVLRGVISQAKGEEIAAQSGVTSADFRIMVEDTGEPPGLQQLDEAYRRKIIDKARLEKGIRQSRIRDEWIPVIEALRYAPMSVSDAVNAVVQNHLSFDTAHQYAEENGLDPAHFRTLVDTAGEPLSRTEMLELWNRGEITQGVVEQALRESRVKDKYIPDVLKLRVRLLPPREISSAVQHGSITRQEGIRQAMAYGYTEKLATAIVGEGSARKLETYRGHVLTAIESLYEDGGLTESQAASMMKPLGYDDAEIKFALQATSLRGRAKLLNSAISAIRSKYLARHITENVASGKLTELGVSASHRDNLLKAWKIEWQAQVAHLTTAEILKAYKRGRITPQNALQRLEDRGFTTGDAALLLEDA